MKVSHEDFNKRVEQMLTPQEGESPNSMLKKMLSAAQNKKTLNAESFPTNDNGQLPVEK